MSETSTAGTSPDAGPRLFTPDAIGAATFLGSPFAGGFAIFLNARALGRSGVGLLSLLVGAVVTAAIIGLGTAVNLNSGLGAVFPLVFAITARAVAGKLFGADLDVAGVRTRGTLAGVVLALPFIAIVLAGVFLVPPGFFDEASVRHEVGGHGVFIRDGATMEDAQAVVELFAYVNYFEGGDFYVDRDDTTFEVGVVLTSVWDETPGHEDAGRTAANQISALAVDGQPARLVVVDPHLTARESYDSDGTLGRGAYWGDDDVLYVRGPITDAEIGDAVAALNASGSRAIQGVAVAISKEGQEPMRGCVLIPDANRNAPNLLAEVEAVVSVLPNVKGVDICDARGRVVGQE